MYEPNVYFTDLTLWPMPMISCPFLRMLLTNSIGIIPASYASLNSLAAASNAPPNRSPYTNKFQQSMTPSQIRQVLVSQIYMTYATHLPSTNCVLCSHLKPAVQFLSLDLLSRCSFINVFFCGQVSMSLST